MTEVIQKPRGSYFAGREEMFYDILFTLHGVPEMVKLDGEFFYKGSKNPVDNSHYLWHLPQPHRDEALAWFEKKFGKKPEKEPEAREEAKKELMCELCDPPTGPYMNIQAKKSHQTFKHK